MPRARIEGLLASFPKLISTGDQHTFVETDSVRYVYQPLEDLFMVLVTNKNSNILQDIDTLHLFSRVVSEHCKNVDEKEVSRQAFDLLSLFDEIISLGYRENVSLSQIRTISEMESHEEKVQAEIERNKEKEAKQELDRKVRLIDHQKREAKREADSGRRTGGYGGSSGGFGNNSSSYSSSNVGYGNSSNNYGNTNSGGFGNNSSSYGNTNYSSSSYGNNDFAKNTSQPSNTASSPVKKGMQLGKKSNQQSLVEAIKTEEGVADMAQSPFANRNTTAAAHAPVGPTESVSVIIEEKISVVANRDGGIQNMEVIGNVNLNITDPAKSHLKIIMDLSNDSGIQYKTNPNVDKKLFSQGIIALRDPSKSFPLNQKLGLLRWRYVTKDDSLIPLSINCWPSPTGSGTCDVNIEYELQKSDMELRDVIISIPFPGNSPPSIGDVEGDYFIDKQKRQIDWQLPLIDNSNASGVLEFTVNSDDTNAFFPVNVIFNSVKTFCDVKVVDVVEFNSGSPIQSSKEVLLTTD
ncbi:Coatomer subunit delta, partial [Clydaea vesicula]